MKRAARVVVHLTLEGFFDRSRREQGLEGLIARTNLFNQCLERHGGGWERPSAAEAVRVITASEDPPRFKLSWAERLREDVRASLGVDASVGIASTRLAARISSRLARPSGLLMLLPGYEPGFLASLPLEELDELRTDQLAVLRRQHIRTVGELARLDRATARSFLGAESVKLLCLVRGIEGRRGRERGSRLERALEVLCRRAAKRMRRALLSARGVELRFLYGDGVSLEQYALLPRPICSSVDFEAAARSLLRRLPIRGEPVVRVSLTATGLAHRAGQLSLFSGTPPPQEITVRLGSGGMDD